MRHDEFVAEWKQDDIVYTDTFIDISGSSSVLFIQTNAIVLNQCDNSASFPPSKSIWITGNSDITISEALVKSYTGKYKHWFAMNLEFVGSPNFTCIPIGIDKHCAPNKPEELYKISKLPRILYNSKLAFLSVNVHTYFCERAAVEVLFKDEPWVTHKYPIAYDEFCREVRSHKFVFCPRGNGYDTIRMWETLYLGSIPIVRENPVACEFAKYLPICIIKDWTHLTPEYLEMEYERITAREDYNFNLMKASYWREKILSMAKSECAEA